MKYLAKPNSDLMFQSVHIQMSFLLCLIYVFEHLYFNVKLMFNQYPSEIETLKCGFRNTVWLMNLQKFYNHGSDTEVVFRRR